MKTNVRQTSMEAYLEVKEKTMTPQQKKVLSVLSGDQPDYSRLEISYLSGIPINSVCGRVNELLKSGAIVETEPRKCSITGKTILPVSKS